MQRCELDKYRKAQGCIYIFKFGRLRVRVGSGPRKPEARDLARALARYPVQWHTPGRAVTRGQPEAFTVNFNDEVDP